MYKPKGRELTDFELDHYAHNGTTARDVYGRFLNTFRIPDGYHIVDFRDPKIGELSPHVYWQEAITWTEIIDNEPRFILKKYY